jgi:hypothetical protein
MVLDARQEAQQQLVARFRRAMVSLFGTESDFAAASLEERQVKSLEIAERYTFEGEKLGIKLDRVRNGGIKLVPNIRSEIEQYGFVQLPREYIKERFVKLFEAKILELFGNNQEAYDRAHLEERRQRAREITYSMQFRGFALGTFVARVRAGRNSLSKEHRSRLDKAGFSWSVLDSKDY